MKYRHEERAGAIIEKLCVEEEGIMRAEKTVKLVDRQYKKFARNMAIMKNSMDRASDLDYARTEGEAIGLAKGEVIGLTKGETKSKLETAGKMKKAGLPIEKIMEFTDLSADVIKRL